MQIITSRKEFAEARSRAPISLRCRKCGGVFTRPKHQIQVALKGVTKSHTHDFCSMSCKATLHGDARRGNRSPEWRCWVGMIRRCANDRDKRFKDYGGRGIKVCVRWRRGFRFFLADMGRKPSLKHSIDRKNNNGNYTPKNCRWATQSQQQKNKRPRSPNKNAPA